MAEGPERIVSSSIAVALLLLYTLVGAVLLLTALHDADVWGREVKIFEALSPLAGGAVGWVFGREVHRKAAEDYRRDARNGQRLAGVIKYASNSLSAGGSKQLVTSGPSAESHLRDILAEAEELFPSEKGGGYSGANGK